MEPTVPSHDHMQLGEIEWTWEDNKAVDNALAELRDHGCPTQFEQTDLTVENAFAGLDRASPNLFDQYFEWTDKALEDPLVVEPNHGAPPLNHLFGWAWEDNKTSENAVAELDHHHVHGSSNLSEPVKLRDPAEIQISDIIEDVQMTEANLVILPNHMNNNGGSSSTTVPKKKAKHPRKKPIPWTSEEHGLFLEGLAKYGKGDWKSISRFCVMTRTPAQVASHAQKYFIRLSKSQNIHGNSNTATTATNAAALSPHYCIF